MTHTHISSHHPAPLKPNQCQRQNMLVVCAHADAATNTLFHTADHCYHLSQHICTCRCLMLLWILVRKWWLMGTEPAPHYCKRPTCLLTKRPTESYITEHSYKPQNGGTKCCNSALLNFNCGTGCTQAWFPQFSIRNTPNPQGTRLR